MTTQDHLHLERRAAQRFEVQTAVSLSFAGSATESCGFTQDLSGRGALLYTDMLLSEGEAIEMTLMMPSEITLGENMRVRCKGRVVRVCGLGTKGGVAVQIEGAYEFLPDEIRNSVSADISSESENLEKSGMSEHVFHLRGAVHS